jgi:hypothetical protein
LFNNTTGYQNTANGTKALFHNTTGCKNTANGTRALFNNTTGYHNIGVGQIALINNTSGSENTAVGYRSLGFNHSGHHNVAIGYYTLSENISGSNNTAIGTQAFQSLDNLSNTIALGYNAQPVLSNTARIGNSYLTEIGGFTNWSNVSDARFKTSVKTNIPGLKFINKLNPVSYQMDMEAIATHQKTPDSLRLFKAEKTKAKIRYTGFLAQEVEAAANAIDYDFSGVHAPKNERDNYSISYAEFVVPLVKAVQEMDEALKSKNHQVEALEKQNAKLEKRLEKIERMLERL